ncbi:amidase [Novosphingobium sp. SG720]|uniref:amidase n=1 Tax=Novosphingobium sp. SG720 TaxID=2586998 RepID=UPI001446354F|nr:amidase [Novosphingobium sp. SG720]NKJ44084.1 Asp-tRNA(Asn)/Glu-tRNA(Gln) amidotransferase A subunit family amidase [Novosphingobium sp. SG720]
MNYAHSAPLVTARVEAALARIAIRDATVRAWLHVDDTGALATARTLDALAADARGPLHGLIIGVKDVIAVAGMPLTHNSPLFTGQVAAHDAPCVAILRAAGAVILGKTDTTEFAAAGRNAASSNPHDPARTPGGSSAGSAAAVADGHVDVALATQTGGSTIRPASYCGIHGFKPSWGLVSREGVKTYANSLDTVGWHARNLGLIDRLCAAYGLAPALAVPADAPLRIGVFRTPWWDRLASDAQAAFEDVVVAGLARAGVALERIDDLPDFAHLNDDHRAILFREGAASFRDLAHTRGALLHPDFHLRVAALDQFDDERLRLARDRASAATRAFERATNGLDAVLAPSAPGIAPFGRGPGDPLFNQPWTLMQVPVLNLPLARGGQGMPIGVSLVAPRYADRRLIAVAQALEDRLAAVGVQPTDAGPLPA